MRELLTIDNLVDVTKISKPKLWQMATRGELPPPICIGPKLRRWDSAAIEEWIADGCQPWNVTNGNNS